MQERRHPVDDETRKQFNELRGVFLGLREPIDTRFQHIEAPFQQEREYTDERTREMETTLLTEFRKWATQNDLMIKPPVWKSA